MLTVTCTKKILIVNSSPGNIEKAVFVEELRGHPEIKAHFYFFFFFFFYLSFLLFVLSVCWHGKYMTAFTFSSRYVQIQVCFCSSNFKFSTIFWLYALFILWVYCNLCSYVIIWHQVCLLLLILCSGILPCGFFIHIGLCFFFLFHWFVSLKGSFLGYGNSIAYQNFVVWNLLAIIFSSNLSCNSTLFSKIPSFSALSHQFNSFVSTLVFVSYVVHFSSPICI